MKRISFFFKWINYSKKINKYKSIYLPKSTAVSKIFVEQIANNLALWLLDSAASKKAFDRWVTLTIPAKAASLLPPVGPFLGQHGFNTMSFCNTFNTLTKNFPDGLPIKVNIKLFTDKTIQFQLVTPPTSFLLYSAYMLNNSKGVWTKDLLKIVLIKWIDLIALSNLSLLSSVIGTAHSMKFKIV